MARYSRKPRRIGPLFWISLSAAAVIVLLGWYYAVIQDPLWQARKAAKAYILQHSDMQQVNTIRPFINEQYYFVAEGIDANEKPMIVWLSDHAFESSPSESESETPRLHEAYLSEGYPLIFAEEKLLETYPDAVILRKMPGVYQSVYAWEILFEREEAGKGKRKHYAYYRFSDGELLDVYRLAIEPR